MPSDGYPRRPVMVPEGNLGEGMISVGVAVAVGEAVSAANVGDGDAMGVSMSRPGNARMATSAASATITTASRRYVGSPSDATPAAQDAAYEPRQERRLGRETATRDQASDRRLHVG